MNPLRRSHNTSSSSSNSSPSSSSSQSSSSSSSSSWIHLRSVLFVVTSSSPASCSSSDRGRLKSPWSRRKRKHVLSPQQWKNLFTQDGRIRDGGIKFLKRVRSGGVDPSIRAEVWPFLLGVYDLESTKEKRDGIKTQNRKEYEKLRRQCRQLLKHSNGSFKLNEIGEISYEGDGGSFIQDYGSPSSEDATSARESLSSEDRSPDVESDDPSSALNEDFATWQRIIRLDAVRANAEWMPYSPSQAVVPDSRAHRSAEAVGLKDYSHLDASRIFHAARLVAILEAYALYDPEIGYCQGMSDLLSPIVSVIPEDHEAFWCFVGFMKKARQNFRLDEVGIRRQLDIVAKIIKFKDGHLRKLIIEKYSSMDEIIKECNGMAGHLDVWKLLDDAHNLVVTLHDKMKIEASFR
uniref:GTPase-activating protein GYP7 n=1 Tax=Cajanus cajan TaxID=3821 RepID=A0A151RQS4_CAJCA|nr:GTPase-activating protein GYP7 [Cajanus cajan]